MRMRLLRTSSCFLMSSLSLLWLWLCFFCSLPRLIDSFVVLPVVVLVGTNRGFVIRETKTTTTTAASASVATPQQQQFSLVRCKAFCSTSSSRRSSWSYSKRLNKSSGTAIRFGLGATSSSSSSSSQESSSSFSSCFEKACAAFEAAHQEDPRTITITNNNNNNNNNNTILPYSVHYHQRMVHWLNELEPNNTTASSEILQLAARCQHIRRWTRPRSDYPKGLVHYKRWRSDLQKFHAQQAYDILVACGYTSQIANRVGELLRKEKLDEHGDPQVQLLEDVICIVFLENEYTSFIEQNEYEDNNKDDDNKLVNIVKKTWKKMTPRGQQAALKLAGQFTERGLRVVQRALAEEEEEEEASSSS